MSDNVSAYAKSLDNEALKRYLNKLRYDKDLKALPDPYKIASKQWKIDLTLWPELDYAQVFSYLIETPALFNPTSMRNFKSLEAYRYVESGHVQEVLYYDVTDSPFCFLKACVIPSMRTKDKPHEPWVCLTKSSADVYCAHCTCMAGLGETCSHIAAILFKIELGVRYGLTKKSVTSEACRWNQIFKKEVNYSTVKDMQGLMNTNRMKTVECVTPSGKDPLPGLDILNSLYEVCPNASFFTLIPPIEPDQNNASSVPARKPDRFPKLLTSFHNEVLKDDLNVVSQNVMETMTCTQEQIKNLFTATKCQNISPLWYEHGKGRVTGTKAHDILTRKDTTSPDNLVMRIMGYKSYDFKKNDAVKWGLDNESKAKDVYAEHCAKQHLGFSCKPSGFLISEKKSSFGATADGVLQCECCGLGTLEIKCPYKHKDVAVLEAAASDTLFGLDKNMYLKKSHRYYTQVQFQMFVFDCAYCDFVVMTLPENRPNLSITRVYRDDKFINELVLKCAHFFETHVLKEILTGRLHEQQCVRNMETDKRTWCLCEEPEYGKMIVKVKTAALAGFIMPVSMLKGSPEENGFVQSVESDKVLSRHKLYCVHLRI